MKIRICLLIILMGLLYPGYISSQESPYIFRQILIFGKIGSTSWRFPKTYVATVLSPLLSSFASGGANISVVYGHNASL